MTAPVVSCRRHLSAVSLLYSLLCLAVFSACGDETAKQSVPDGDAALDGDVVDGDGPARCTYDSDCAAAYMCCGSTCVRAEQCFCDREGAACLRDSDCGPRNYCGADCTCEMIPPPERPEDGDLDDEIAEDDPEPDLSGLIVTPVLIDFDGAVDGEQNCRLLELSNESEETFLLRSFMFTSRTSRDYYFAEPLDGGDATHLLGEVYPLTPHDSLVTRVCLEPNGPVNACGQIVYRSIGQIEVSYSAVGHNSSKKRQVDLVAGGCASSMSLNAEPRAIDFGAVPLQQVQELTVELWASHYGLGTASICMGPINITQEGDAFWRTASLQLDEGGLFWNEYYQRFQVMFQAKYPGDYIGKLHVQNNACRIFGDYIVPLHACAYDPDDPESLAACEGDGDADGDGDLDGESDVTSEGSEVNGDE